jgi:hypothetical protein
LPPDEKTTAAYICTDHVCSLPTTSPKDMMRLLGEKGDKSNSRKTYP